MNRFLLVASLLLTGQIHFGSSAFAQGAGPNPAATAFKILFYDNNFSYLEDPCYDGHYLGDCMKLMPVAGGDWGTLDFGGQVRNRYHHEVGMGREGSAATPRFQDTRTDFVLTRLRLYTNWQVNEKFRIYGEGIFADASDDGGLYFPRPIDLNWGDFLNLFVDVKLTDTMTARVGRQELLYGNQRLISPLDWANTRRTFDGARLLYTNGDWEVDTFYTFFVPVIPNELDEPDYNQRFYGMYGSYNGFENFTVQPYYIGYDNHNPGAITSDFSLHTLGIRVFGGTGDWLWELEGGPQFGRQSGLGLDDSAGFATIGLGRKSSTFPGSPTLWFYYDYASGNADGGSFNRFNQLFPLAHKYFGFIDAVQRANIESPNILLTAKPGAKWTLLMWYWHFMANTDDIVPSVGNTPPQHTTGSKDLGDELDVLIKYNIAPRTNVVFGWSHFWRGDKIIGTTDADFLYGQWELNF